MAEEPKQTADPQGLQETAKDLLRWIANSADHVATLARLGAPRDILENEIDRLTRRLKALQDLEGPDPLAAEAARREHWNKVEHRLANETQADWGIAILKRRHGTSKRRGWWFRWWRG